MSNASTEKQMLQARKRTLETIKKKIKKNLDNSKKFSKKITECNRKINSLTKQQEKAPTEAKAKAIHGKIYMATGSLHSAERMYNASLKHIEYWKNEYYKVQNMPINQQYHFQSWF